MSSTTTESDGEMLSKDQVDSPSFEEGSCGGSFEGGTVLKKGPWTSAEDAILVDYVKKNGEGNWNAVQKHSGLSRCGKSCRLRWANHLRPNLKKGAFTPEEEHLIIELHAKMGNKWARMAAHDLKLSKNQLSMSAVQRKGKSYQPRRVFHVRMLYLMEVGLCRVQNMPRTNSFRLMLYQHLLKKISATITNDCLLNPLHQIKDGVITCGITCLQFVKCLNFLRFSIYSIRAFAT